MPDFRGHTLLAPLTRGGNLPFRRLCVGFGAVVTLSEMAYARQVVRRSRPEMALLKCHPDEPCFGVQLAAGRAEDAIAAGSTAVERGARFIDVNAGCPIHDVVRRGMGATLLRRPAAFARMVEAMVAALPVPVTVKIRAGWDEDDVNCREVARLVEAAGAAAITLHARTREQRYSRAADWELVRALAGECRVPVIGNGDILTWYEAEDRQRASGCAAVMVGRGALIKPWLFDEIRTRRTWLPTAVERVSVYRRFVALLKEHFGVDERGRRRAMFFLPWHFGFFCRYRPMPEPLFRDVSREHPLMQTRFPDDEELEPLERLLRDPREDIHVRLAETLWDAADDDAAIVRLREVAAAVSPPENDHAEVEVAHG